VKKSERRGPLSLLQKVVEGNRVVALMLAVAALVGAVVTINSTTRTTLGWYDRQFRWSDHVEESLEALRPNVTVHEFDRRLGDPRVVTRSESGLTSQRLYQGREYWVQAVADETGSILWFAVTVCSEELDPSWRVWNSRDAYITLRLHETAVVGSRLEPSGYVWNIPGATANEYIYAVYYGGNPTNYQTYAWGYNDACADGDGPIDGELSRAESDAMLDHSSSADEPEGEEDYGALPPEAVQELPDGLVSPFRRVRANTFAIFGVIRPDQEPEFQIGADRILTRTLIDAEP
jgi:hypothetical protein